MDLMLTDDQAQIVDTARAMLAKELPVDHLRWEAGPAAAADRRLLSSFAELGWIGLGVPEEQGGVGFSVAEEALLMVEAGRRLVTPMLLAAMVSARLAAGHDPALAERIIAGEAACGLGVPKAGGGVYLIEGDAAAFILVAGPTEVYLAPRDAFGEAAPLRSLDSALDLGLAAGDGRSQAVASDAGLADHLSLLVAAYLTGVAEAVRDLSVTHASERAQFGQKIGTFQAVSHPCADMAVRCEAALSQTKFAAVVLRDGLPEAARQIASARVIAAEAAVANATAAIQLHGGMGFAAEYPIHFFLKRAHVLDRTGGGRAAQLDRLIAL